MNITNKTNIPKYLFDILVIDEYDKHDGVWSASDIKKPSRMFALEQINKDKTEIDVIDLIPSWYGTAIHNMFEKADLKQFEQEKRLYGEILGQKISGKFDLLEKLEDGFRLKDIKSTSVWKYINKDFDDYVIQLSIYRWLLSNNGYENISNTADIIFFFTDWTKSKTINDDYPNSRLVEQEIQLMSLQEIEVYMENRIINHRIALDLIQKEMETKEITVKCDKKDLWQDEDKYAVMKKGGARAIKLCNDLMDAKEIINNHKDKDKLFIQKRVSEPKRCEYCCCKPFCLQYKGFLNKKYD